MKRMFKRDANVLNNEKGIALFMVLVLSVILLSITAAVLYMVIEGTQSSGREKRYKTALEASLGGLDVSYEVIGTRGATAVLEAILDAGGHDATITTLPGCKPTAVAECVALDDYDADYTSITTKLRLPTTILLSDGVSVDTCWTAGPAGCSTSLTIDPDVPATYDMHFELGTGVGSNRIYDVFVKIVDTTMGNSASPSDWEDNCVVDCNDEITVPKIPYLYTIEVLSQAQDNPMERARSSALYEY